MPKPPTDIPQILAIVRPSADSKIPLKKDVRAYLGAEDDALYLDDGEEILLSASPSDSATPVERQATRAILPSSAIARIGLKKGDSLAMIQRDGALALKKLAVEERAGERAEVVDLETPLQVTRVACTNPMPDELLPELADQYRLLYRHL